MLTSILENNDSRYPPELRINVCQLATAVGRATSNLKDEEESGAERKKLSESIHPVLERIVQENLTLSALSPVEISLREAGKRALNVL